MCSECVYIVLFRIVVPLSNISGFLEKENDQQLTISESIAIAEKIYQNEKRQIMNLGKRGNQDSKSTNYVESERLKCVEFDNPFEVNVIEQKNTLSRQESPNSIITEGNCKKGPIEGKLSHICDVSDDTDGDDESIASKVWNMFMKATSSRSNGDPQVRNRGQSNSKVVILTDSRMSAGNEIKNNKGEYNWRGIERDRGVRNERQWIKENYNVTSREALDIVEGTIRKINNVL